MKRILCLVLGISALTGLAAGQSLAAAQSLGDIARKLRQQKRPVASKVYTEENLPTSAIINIGGDAAAAEKQPAADMAENEAASAEVASTAAGDAKAPGGEAAPATAEEQQKRMSEWKAKFDDQKKSISLLERELDVMQRENKQRTALFYADAGSQLRDSRQWTEDQAKYEAQIAAKDKDLAAARQKLEDMKEEARKAGMPSSVSD